eukprot:10922083-Heterocapsa_arctica.AAC.1
MAASDAVTKAEFDNMTAKLEVYASSTSTNVATLESTITAQTVTLTAQSTAINDIKAVLQSGED